MSKKQQVILYHGAGTFNQPNTLVHGEVAIEHGNGAENVKIHTIDNSGNLATFISKTAIDNIISPISTNVETLVGTVGDATKGLVKAVTLNTTNIGTNAGAIATLQETVGDNSKGLVKAVTELQNTIGDGEGENTLTSRVSTLETNVSTLEGTVGDETKGLVQAVNTLNGTNTTTGSVAYSIKTAIEALDAVVGSTTVDEDKHVAVQVTEVDGVLTGVVVTESDIASAAALSTVSGKVDTLIGTNDSNKSVRTIANEELAAVLLNGADNGAEDNFKTLKEIADWIEKHPEDAAAMNSAIEALNAATAGFSKDATIKTTTDALSNKLAELIGTDGTTGSIANSITDAIEALDAVVGSTTVDEGKHVAVQVTEVDGVVTGVVVTESDIASAETLSNVSGKVSTLEGTVGDDSKGLVQAVNTLNGTNTTTGSVAYSIKTAIETLDAVVGSTTVDEDKHVAVQVTEVDGVLTGVVVTESDIASAAALSTVSGKVDTLETNHIKAIQIQNGGATGNKITATSTGNNTWTLDFDAMVIDCGTY